MPRINIEDSIYKDDRFDELKNLLGGKQYALGALCGLGPWRSRNGREERLASNARSGTGKALETKIIDVGLARIDGDFVYVCGSKQILSGSTRDRRPDAGVGTASPEIQGRLW